ncbi:MAG TPA: DciA family protein [Gammaproteobacteria bacterium]|nr:DciA family protein [Gammaproteobacteria bacterium]
MPAPKLNSLTELVSGSSLARLGAEARRISQLRDTVRRRLPPEQAPWCLGAEIRDTTLLIYMASAATATAVRYRQQALLAALGADLGRPLSRLEVRVMPDPPLPPAPRPVPRVLSEAVRHLLEQTAEDVNDESLAHSLQRLARRHKHPGD